MAARVVWVLWLAACVQNTKEPLSPDIGDPDATDEAAAGDAASDASDGADPADTDEAARPFDELFSDVDAPASDDELPEDTGMPNPWGRPSDSDRQTDAGFDSGTTDSDVGAWFPTDFWGRGSDTGGSGSDTGGGGGGGVVLPTDWPDTDTDVFVTDFAFDTGAAAAQPTSCTVRRPARVAVCGAAGVAAAIGNNTFSILADAVAAASPGDEVVVCPGSHQGGFDAADLSLVAADPTSGATEITGGGRVRVIQHTGGDLVLEGLTLVDGSAQDGAAVGGSGTSLTVTCVTARTNNAQGDGGAIQASGSGKVTIDRSLFEQNRAGYAGGAISAQSAVIVDSVFSGNYADYEGGAISARGDLTVSGTSFLQNSADYSGGAISFGDWDSRRLTLTNDTFVGNNAGYEGGAITFGTWAEADVAEIVDSVFEGNTSDGDGGAINFGTWGGFAASMTRTRFSKNVANNGAAIQQGGWTQQGATLSLVDVTLADGVARRGAGAALSVSFGDLPTKVDATRVSVLRNSGGSAVSIRSVDSFTCTGCDFGTGVDDNTPSDAAKGGVVTHPAPATFSL